MSLSRSILGCTMLLSSSSLADDGPYAVVERLANVLVHVEQNYVDPVDRSRLVDGATTGMVAELDPHSAYLTPTQFAQFLEDTQGQFAGLGVEVDFRDDVVTVIATMPNSPAERAGIKAGDRIVAVDGASIAGVRAELLIRRMRGPVGTAVKVTIRRNGSVEPMTLNVTRAVVTVKCVEGRLFDGGIAYIRLRAFQEGCYVELLERLAALNQTTRAKGLILDFRGNPGGLVSEAVAIADEFLDRGVIYSARHRGKVVEVVESRTGDLLEKLPLLVLVNAATASSAEIVAGALQDRGRALVVGVRTFGKGSVQNIIELEGGAGLLLTTLRYFTPNGQAIQARGLMPDFEVHEQHATHVLREADIAGHLPTEGTAVAPTTPASASAPEQRVTTVEAFKGKFEGETEAPSASHTDEEDTPRQDAASTADLAKPAIGNGDSPRRRVLPERRAIDGLLSNPKADNDPVLAKGYELLLAKITK